MKKILLSATALAGLVMMSAPAHADGLNMGVGGFFRGYAVITDNNETGSAATGDDLRTFDFRRHTEIHFSGETTTDNGLTVGAHVELKTSDDTAANSIDETYGYFSGSWGRVNFGSEDGAAYLLQVAAPSADSNVDGMRVYIQGLNTDLWDDADFTTALPAAYKDSLGYDNAPFQNTDKITYLTPKFNGFQAGVSYAPEMGQNAIGNNVAGMTTDDDAGDFENIFEVSARWDGEFEGFGISAGAGYINASTEVDAGAGTPGSDDLTSWDAGLNVAFSGFSLGGAYVNSDNGISGANSDTTTWLVGAGWDNGPYHVGASWMDRTDESSVTGLAAGVDLDVQRFTIGGGYTFAPGMSFRGAVAFGSVDNNTAGVTSFDENFTQATIGTDIAF